MSVPVEVAQPVVAVRDAFCTHVLTASERAGGSSAVIALRGLDLQVAAAERVVVHGPNGAGKTTLMRLLAGEQELAAGVAVVAGHRVGVRGATPPPNLGWIDQRARSMIRPEFNVLGNLTLQQRISGVDEHSARQLASDLAARLGIGHLLDRQVATLSGGERQRVAVCAAVMHRPQLVLADEPTGELDLKSAQVVYETLRSAVHEVGAALVLVSHDPRAAMVADRVIRIRDGRLSETWTPSDSSATARESLVVDERGWVRLPEALRRQAGIGAQVYAEGDSGALRLYPDGDRNAIELKTARPQRARPIEAEPVAELRTVSVSYGDRLVLEEFSLALRPGEITVLAGRSGAGKSSLLRVLTGLQPPQTGEVVWQGADICDWDRTRLAISRRELMAVTDQENVVPDGLDVITMIDTARAVRGLPSVPDGDLAALLDDLGIGHLATRRLTTLSGGERQRAAVARTLLTDARLLVLDEPTSQLDETGARAVIAALTRAAAAGTAVLVASHDERVIAVAGQVRELS